MKILFLILSFSCFASDIAPYQETDNQSMNKRERIGSIEKYLSNFSNTLKSMEDKIDIQSKQIKELQSDIQLLKETLKSNKTIP